MPGLRREEVALLAGVSVDYYVRLEQGRETSPSSQVADALGTALRLDDQARLHLFRLAGLAPYRSETVQEVDPSVRGLLEDWPGPAVVLGDAFDVLAANALAEELFRGFAPTRNLVESVFLAPDARDLYPDWEEVAEYTAAGLRILQSATPDDLRVAEVVARLTAGSSHFRALWDDRLARGRRVTHKSVRHPEVGVLRLEVHAADLRAFPGQELVLYRAAPGSPDAARLARLRTQSANG